MRYHKHCRHLHSSLYGIEIAQELYHTSTWYTCDHTCMQYICTYGWSSAQVLTLCMHMHTNIPYNLIIESRSISWDFTMNQYLSKKLITTRSIHHYASLVPRPLPTFQHAILKNWEWPEDDATITHCTLHIHARHMHACRRQSITRACTRHMPTERQAVCQHFHDPSAWPDQSSPTSTTHRDQRETNSLAPHTTSKGFWRSIF